MVKRIGRRFVSLLLTFVTILTLLPAMTLPALAASGTVTGLADESIGLSFSGDAEDAWIANGALIKGAATSTAGFCSNTDYNSTLTITNQKRTKATLSFDYAIEKNDGTIKVDGKSKTENKFSKTLNVGEKVTVYISSNSTNAATTITMTNVKLVADATAKVTFQPAENGSYTVDGTGITVDRTITRSSMIDYPVNATPADGYQFMGWYDMTHGKYISTAAATALNIESDCTITARFASKTETLFETAGQRFVDLNDAIAEAQKNLPATIVLASDGSIAGNYTIPSEVTLLIPFDEAGTLYKATPTATRENNPATKPFRTLTMAAGSSITLASGAAISVGGQYYAGGGGQSGKMVGPYGCIKMESRSAITVQGGASLYAWGFISGSGAVTVENGGSVYEWYQILDFRGGTASSGMGNKVFPFNQYAVQNIEVPLTVHTGANEKAYAAIFAMDKTFRSSISFIGAGSLFVLNSGRLTKAYDGNTDRMIYTIDGVALLNNLSLSLGGRKDINSENYVLPLTNNMTVNLTQGSKLTMNQTAALLPGVEVSIARDAELEVPNDQRMYIYDRDEWVAQNFVTGGKFKAVPYAPGKHYTRTEENLIDVKVDVNGTLTASGGIYTTAGGADICSSEGTGKYVQQGTPGTETTTYQYTQVDSSVTAHEIPITPAQLQNADGADKPYTETKDAKAGDTFTYCKCQDCGDGTWVKDVAAIINNGTQGDTYSTLEAAVNAYSPDNSTAPTNYIKLLHNTTEKPISVNNKNLRLDLNGRTVTGDISVTGTYKLYGMDSSAKADYTTAPTGKIVGTVTGTVAPTYETPKVTTTDGDTYDRYVAIPGTEADGNTPNLSFHHFNISVTGYRFELATGDTPQCALFFIGKFQGDAEAKKHLTSLGFTLPDIDGTTKTVSCKMPESLNDGAEGEKSVIPEGGAYLFEAYLKRDINKENYQTPFTATAQATFDNGGKQDSKPQTLSFKDAWQKAEDLTDEQKKAILDKLGINP